MEYWYSFIYLYGVGGILVAIATYLGIKNRVIKLERAKDRHVLYGIVGAFALYFSLQGVWTIFAILSK